MTFTIPEGLTILTGHRAVDDAMDDAGRAYGDEHDDAYIRAVRDLGKSARDAVVLRVAVDRLRAEHGDQGDDIGWSGPNRDQYGTIERTCRVCGTPGEYAVEWPCPTRRLLDETIARLS